MQPDVKRTNTGRDNFNAGGAASPKYDMSCWNWYGLRQNNWTVPYGAYAIGNMKAGGMAEDRGCGWIFRKSMRLSMNKMDRYLP